MRPPCAAGWVPSDSCLPHPGAAVPRTCWMCAPVSGTAPPGAELLGKEEPVKIQVGLEQEKVCVWNTAESGVV